MSNKKSDSKKRYLSLAVFLVLFVAGGVLLLSRTHAATPFLSQEVEAGTVKGTATILTDTSASGGKAIIFKPAATPQPVAYYYGACPENPGGSSLAAAQKVITKWGTGASIREFNGSDLTKGPYHPAGASIVHTSYRPVSTEAVNNGSLDSQIEALINRTPAGDVLEFWHEADNDGLTPAQITEMIKAKNRLYEIKQRIKPSVLVTQTMTGGLFASYSTDAQRRVWDGLKGDLVGMDADGVHDTTGPTYDMTYADEVSNVKAFLARNSQQGWIGWAAPEWATSRQPWDSTGQARADWYSQQAKILAGGGARYINIFDYNTPEHSAVDNFAVIPVDSPEFKVLQPLIAHNPHK